MAMTNLNHLTGHDLLLGHCASILVMSLDLSSSWLKVDRATEHLQELNAEAVTRTMEGKGKLALAVPHRHPKDQRCVIFNAVGLVKFDGLRTGIVVGDFVQNLRAALDHLAWQLVCAGRKPPETLSPGARKQIQFPLESKFRSRLKGVGYQANIGARLPGVRREDLTIVKRYQPYHRGQASRLLGVLADLSNVDKHRTLTPILMATTVFDPHTIRVRPGTMRSYVPKLSPGKAVQEGAEILRVYVDRPNAEVDVYVDLTCEPALESREPVFPTLHSMGVRVAQVLLEFGLPPAWAHVPSAHDLAALR